MGQLKSNPDPLGRAGCPTGGTPGDKNEKAPRRCGAFSSFGRDVNGGGKRIRTADTQTASLVLYQLSYTPTREA